jgi:ATP-dependent Clp protease ATP-binding subunit ClpX
VAETSPLPDSETDPSAVRLQKWVDNVLALHWSPKDYAKLALSKRVIGQDDAVQAMAVLMRQHVKRLQAAIQGSSWMLPPSVRETRPTLLIGSSGCGKTLLATTVAKIATLPFACHDLTNLTAQGWVGMSTGDLVSGLLMRSDGQPAPARWGLLFLDEFDKLRSNDTTGADVGGQGAQRSLLNLLDGGTIQLEWPPTGPREARSWQSFSTANLMIILAGAFSGLSDIIARRIGRERRIGFGVRRDTQSDSHQLLQQVTSEDLIAYGLIPEIVGRLNVVVMRDLSREALKEILIKAPDGPLAVQQRMAQREKFRLKLTAELVDVIVDEAMAQGLGARSLHAMLTRACQRVFFEVPSQINQFDDGTHTVTLGPEALVDGSYELHYRRRQPLEAEQRKLVEDVRQRLSKTGESRAGGA